MNKEEILYTRLGVEGYELSTTTSIVDKVVVETCHYVTWHTIKAGDIKEQLTKEEYDVLYEGLCNTVRCNVGWGYKNE